MSPLLLIVLLSLGQASAGPIKESAVETNDPKIAHLSQMLDVLNDALADQMSKTGHPEGSKVIKKLREKIVRTEAAVEERKAALRSQNTPPPWRFRLLPPARPAEPTTMLL